MSERWQWRWEIPQWLFIASMLAASLAILPVAPEEMPVHWGLNGMPDRYGTRLEGLLLLPVIASGLYLLLRVLPRLDPRRKEYEHLDGVFGAMRIAIMAVITMMHLSIISTALGWQATPATVVPFCVGLLLALFGAALPSVQPNWIIGIRTPWTLSSDQAWERTQEHGGHLFIAMGLMLVVAAVVQAPWLLVSTLALDGIAVLWMIGYSYVAWKRDPERRPVTVRIWSA